MVTTATSSSNLNISQSIILHSSKSTQTQANHNEQRSIVYPLYCFSVKDAQVLPLMLSSLPSSANIPIGKAVTSSLTPLCINKQNPFDSTVLPLTTDNHSHFSHHPTIASMISSNSNITSLQTTQNILEDDVLSKIHHSSSSLRDTRICHFDKHNCLIECYHSSNPGNKHRSNFLHSSNTKTHASDIVFAESTCQLIKQAWLSSTSKS
jgi:hypothetical protein